MTDRQPNEVDQILDSIINSGTPTYLDELKNKTELLKNKNDRDESLLNVERRVSEEDRRITAKSRASNATSSNSLTDRGPLNDMDTKMSEDNHKKGTFH